MALTRLFFFLEHTMSSWSRNNNFTTTVTNINTGRWNKQYSDVNTTWTPSRVANVSYCKGRDERTTKKHRWAKHTKIRAQLSFGRSCLFLFLFILSRRVPVCMCRCNCVHVTWSIAHGVCVRMRRLTGNADGDTGQNMRCVISAKTISRLWTWWWKIQWAFQQHPKAKDLSASSEEGLEKRGVCYKNSRNLKKNQISEIRVRANLEPRYSAWQPRIMPQSHALLEEPIKTLYRGYTVVMSGKETR